MKRARVWAGLLLLLAVCAAARPAQATGFNGSRSFVGVGLTAGASTARDNSAPFIGAEGSLVHFATFAWAGVYSDTLYSFGERHVRFSLGPELGVGPFGLDGGYVMALGRGGFQQGIAVRPMITLAYVTLYYRYEQLEGRSGNLSEVGVLLKGFKGL